MKKLYILSAPSATGKNTVFEKVQEKISAVQRAITCTTREVRSNEKDGVDYYFLSEKEFNEKLNDGEYVEYNDFGTARYGTLRKEIERFDAETLLFCIVDVNGKEKIVKEYPDAVSIFIKPPSLEELEKRMRKRGENTEEDIQKRLATAKKELEKADTFDYVLVNVDADVCAEEICQIVLNTAQV